MQWQQSTKPALVIRGIDRALTFLPANAFATERDQLKDLRETCEQLMQLGGNDKVSPLVTSVRSFLLKRAKTQMAAVEFILASADANASAYGRAARGVGDPDGPGGAPSIPGETRMLQDGSTF